MENAAGIVHEEKLQQAVAQSADAVVEDQVSAWRCRTGLALSRISHALILMNMFTENVKPRKRGRPPGQTAQGAAAKDRLYAIAMRLIAQRGLRSDDPSRYRERGGRQRRASISLLPEQTGRRHRALRRAVGRVRAVRLRQCRPGRWRDRFIFALKTSLAGARAAPDGAPGAHAGAGWRSRRGHFFREHGVLPSSRAAGVRGGGRLSRRDAPKQPLAEALGRLLYLVHLAVLLWWLLDKSPQQRATAALVSLTQQLLPSAALALRVPPVRRFVISVDELVREALFGNPVSA